MPLTLTTAPAIEPVTLDEVKAHLRITHTEDDAYIEDELIPTARDLAEETSGRSFIEQTWTLVLSSFESGRLLLPKPPLSSVTSVQYVDTNGVTQTLAATEYTVVKSTGPKALHGWIEEAWSKTYPTTRLVPEAVTILFVTGYGTAASDVPKRIKWVIKMLCEDLYGFRGTHERGQVALTGPYMTSLRLLSAYNACRDDLRLD